MPVARLLKKSARQIPVVYSTMVDELTRAISSGELAPGSRIPGENELAINYNISRSSVRLALNDLEKSGLIVKKCGKGSFVRHDEPNEQLPEMFNIGINALSSGNRHNVDWYESKIIANILPVCENNNARLSVFNSDKLSALQKRYIDGAIILFFNGNSADLDSLCQRGIEPILFNRISSRENIAYVAVDYRAASYAAGEFMLRGDTGQIGFICSSENNDTANDLRYVGFLGAMHDNGIANIMQCDVEPCRDENYYTDVITSFLAATPRPHSLFLPNGSLAVPTFNAMRKLKLKAPDDITLMCFDDIDYLFPMYKIPFAYVKMPLAQMAADAAGYLLQRLAAPSTVTLKKLYKAEIELCQEVCKNV